MKCPKCNKSDEVVNDHPTCLRCGEKIDTAQNVGWAGKLTHDRSDYADWGWIRDESGDLIVIVRPPSMTEDQENQHRREGTDPAQSRVDVILAAINRNDNQ